MASTESEGRSAGIREDGKGELTLGETTLGRKDQISTDQTNPSDMEQTHQDKSMAAEQRPDSTISYRSKATEGFDLTDVEGSGPPSEEQPARKIAAGNKLGDLQATKSSDTEKMPTEKSCRSSTTCVKQDDCTGLPADGTDSSAQQGVSSPHQSRTFDQQARTHLNKMYSYWKKPGRTIIVGDFPPDKSDDAGYLAEACILQLLEEFGRKTNEPMFVVHSFSFNELKKYVTGGRPVKENIQGEHDFVIIHLRYGVIFMQVKSKNTTAKAYQEAQDQLSKDLESLKIFLEDRLDGGDVKTATRKTASKKVYKAAYVAMPNCSKQDAGGMRGLFKEDCESSSAFESWWKANVEGLRVEGFTQEVFEHLVIRFVGLSKRISTCLQHSLDNTQKKIEKSTEKELRPLLNFCCAVTWITGPAASGKTWLLTQKVHELAKEDGGFKGILFMCHSERSAQNLRQGEFKEYMEDAVQVQTYKGFLEIIKQSKIQNTPAPVYQHIFVDEAQFFVSEDEDWVKSIEKYLFSEDLGPHYLWIAYDPSDCLRECVSNTVQKHVSQSCKLNTVVGCSEKIFNLFLNYLSVDPQKRTQLTHVGSAGLDVVWDNCLASSDKEELVVKQVKILLAENVKQRDICVLVENQEEKAKLVKKLELEEVSYVEKVNQEEEGIIVETIENFSNQRSKVVILLDPSTSLQERSTRRLLYIGVSRCSCYLVVISSRDGHLALESALAEHVPSGV